MNKNVIKQLITKIESESLANKEPAESVQVGRLQVCDELKTLLNLNKKEKTKIRQNKL